MQNWVDLHSHILPDLDDGPAELSESLDILKGLGELGFGHVFATPHHRLYSWEGIRAEAVEKAVMDLRMTASERGIDVALLPGMEFDFDDVLDKGKFALPGGARHVLVDIGFGGIPANLVPLMGKVMDTGNKVFMVHPERNRELCGKRDNLSGLVKAGVKFIGNLGSLSGLYGSRARRDAHGLLEGGYYWTMASDAHSREQLKWIRDGLVELTSRAGGDAVEAMLGNRPMELIHAMEGIS